MRTSVLQAHMRMSSQRSLSTLSAKVDNIRGKSTVAVSDSLGFEKASDPKEPLPVPDFSDARTAFESKSTLELLRASLVFSLCGIPPLVKHGDSLLKWSRWILGDFITDGALKATLFGHFCAGEDEKRIQPAIAQLRRNGIGGILDYAAESDVEPAKKPTDDDVVRAEFNQPAREYGYESEAACDRHVDVFRSCIRSVANVSPDGFAAIKVTALGNPLLLERMSLAIVESKNLFARFDLDGDGFVNRDEFEKGYR